MSPADARNFWKALTGNASALIADAELLVSAGSHGRARSLAVLAQEELGKALWIYDTFSQAWSDGDQAPRSVGQLKTHGRSHTRKYFEAAVFGNELGAFWGDYSSGLLEGETWEEAYQRQEREAEEASEAANVDKQRGFYVDRDDDGSLHSPTDIPLGTIAEDLQLAAQVVEMLLIRDHTRLQADGTVELENTYEQQRRLLPVAHPDDWAAASEEFRTGKAEASSDSPQIGKPSREG